MTPIIKSLLDSDLYKFTVQQIAFNRFGNIMAQYEFTCRNHKIAQLLQFVPEEELREQIFEHLPNLKLTETEYAWLLNRGYFQETYLQYLLNFRFNPALQVEITRDEENDTYRIKIFGPWTAIILYETLVLSIVNEIYESNFIKQTNLDREGVLNVGLDRLQDKITKLRVYNQECRDAGRSLLKFIEFGSRRRFSRVWQELITGKLQDELPENLIGTSNVHLAMSLGLKEIGTFGHEFIMAMQGIYPVQKSQRMAFRVWQQEYNGAWGIALTDTLGDEKFFKDWTFDLAKAYDGVRHDSGDPFAYGERILKMYEGFGIDPKTKKLVFSDGLDFDKMILLHRQFADRIQVSFGIGTDLTNDLGLPTLQIVIKIMKSNGQPVAKLSANPAKTMCLDKLYLEYLIHAVADF